MSSVSTPEKAIEYFNRDTLKTFLTRRQEPAWMVKFREEALSLFEMLPWPTTADEEWRRTNISNISFGDFHFLENEVPAAGTQAGQVDGLAGRIHFRGYVPSEAVLSPELQQKGVVFTTLADAVNSHPELIREYFMTRNVRPGEGKFEALHAAFWTHGVVLYVPRNVEIEQPFLTIFEEVGEQKATFPHVLVILEPGARAAFLSEIISGDKGAVFRNSVINLFVQDNAALKYAEVQNLNESSYNFMNGWSELQRDAHIYSLIGTFGSKLTKNRLGGGAMGPGADAELHGVYFAHHKQHFDQRTIQYHEAPHARTNVFYKGVVKDKAHTIYQGLIRVFKGAQKTDAYQQNKNLSLNDGARADSIPSLEIEANDVRCTHGATVGKVNEEEVFYLMSRGLPRAEAKKLLVEGFLDEVILQAPQVIQDILHPWVARKLESIQE